MRECCSVADKISRLRFLGNVKPLSKRYCLGSNAEELQHGVSIKRRFTPRAADKLVITGCFTYRVTIEPKSASCECSIRKSARTFLFIELRLFKGRAPEPGEAVRSRQSMLIDAN